MRSSPAFDPGPVASALYDAQYRLLHADGKLYVSIQILSDSDTSATDYVDAVYFGFDEGLPATGARVVAIAPNRGTPVAGPDPDMPRDAALPVITDAGWINWYDTTNIVPDPPTWTPHAGNQPVWLEDVATWTDSPGVTWAVTFKADLALSNSQSTSKFFVGARIHRDDDTTVRLGNSVADRASSSALEKFAPWKPIAGTSPTLFTDPGASFTSPTWAWSYEQGASDATTTTDFTCEVQGGGGYCPKLESMNPDQCLLVELGPAPGFQSQLLFASGGVVVCDMSFTGLTNPEPPGDEAGGADGGGSTPNEGAGGSPDPGSGSAGASSKGKNDTDDGCGCRTAGATNHELFGAWSLVLGALCLGARRARNRATR